LAPIIPHTADEVYSHIPGVTEASVYLTQMPAGVEYENAADLTQKWEQVLSIRQHVLKALELARVAKVIGKSLTAAVELYVNEENATLLNSVKANLQQIFIVSQLTVTKEQAPVGAHEFNGVAVVVKAAVGETCDRCWQVVATVNQDGICSRCTDVINP